MIRSWKIPDFFELNKTSVSFARFFLGLLLFFYYWGILAEVDVFYSQKAIVPYDVILRISGEISAFPLFKISTSSFFTYLLAFCGMLCSLLLMSGRLIKTALISAWILTMAFSSRFPDLSFAADNTMKLLLFWFIFLSINYQDERKTRAVHFMWLFQLILMYEFSVFQKLSSPRWVETFDAVYFIAHSTHLLKVPGSILSMLPYSVHKLITVLTLVLEVAGPLALLLPKKKIRNWTILLFLLFHVVIFLTIDVGLFSLLCIVFWLTLLPESFWNYQFITRFKAWFEKSNQPTNSPLLSRISFISISFLFLLIIVQTINQITEYALYRRDALPAVIVNRLQIKPNWNMFTHNPPPGYDGWFIAEASYRDGKRIDLYTGRAPELNHPENHKIFYPTIHWRTFLRKFRTRFPKAFKHYYGNYLCQIAASSKQDIIAVKLVFIRNEITTNKPSTIFEEPVFYKNCEQ